jgi:asparagine synthase (glutamine-hydrolysing)
MCGIAGHIRFDGQAVSARVLERMCAAIEHRGPDSRGIHADEGAGLGIQRLRVIDLETGDQPIYNEDRSVVVVLNGEIYNYRELRQRLEAAGHRFATDGDTETIVHLYEEEGVDCVRSLAGMFAFALWDDKRKRLLVARDRVGKKPLVYWSDGRQLAFASELGALLQLPDVPREVDHEALDAYVAYRWVPSPRTAFRGVHKLPPACRLVYEGGQARVDRYWSLDYGTKTEVSSEAELDEQLRERLRAAVRRRLVSDVPLGAFLSGGIDSSAVVAAMAAESSGQVRTFSIGFESEEYNELPLARIVARRFDTEHHEFVVRPDATAILPRIVRHYGEPFADASAVPSFYVAEMARRHVTVALNGDGGDENFAGYSRYISNLALHRLDAVPRAIRRGIGRIARRVPANGRIDSWQTRLRRVSATMALDPETRYERYMTSLDGLDRDRLYTREYADMLDESIVADVVVRPFRETSANHFLDAMLDVDVRTYLPDDLLTKIDIASMAHSLEARSPFLDHDFMQFVAGLPVDQKLRGTTTKVALRRALRGWVPDEVLDAPKRGFRLPVHDWFRGELRDFAREVLLDRSSVGRGYFHAGYIEELLDDHAGERADYSQGLWTLLMFELWHREFVDRSPEVVTSATGLA